MRILFSNGNFIKKVLIFVSTPYLHDKESVVNEKNMNNWVFVRKYIIISVPGMFFLNFPLKIVSNTFSIDFKFHGQIPPCIPLHRIQKSLGKFKNYFSSHIPHWHFYRVFLHQSESYDGFYVNIDKNNFAK